MVLDVTLYETDMLDFVNIPSNLGVLNSYPNFKVNAIWELQDRILPTLKIQTVYEKVQNVSYALVGKVLYHVTGVTMSNENVAILSLLIEPLNTIGLNNITSVDGQANRLHTNDSNLLDNIAVEPFQPQYPMIVEMEEIKIDKSVTSFVAVTMSLNFKDDKPTVMPVTTTKIYNAVWESGDKYETSMQGIGLYEYNASVQQKLTQLQKWGMQDAIVASYTIPNKFISNKSVDSSTGFVSQIWSTGFSHTSKFKAEYGNAKNKKVFSGQYSYITLVSTVSGDNKTFSPKEIYSDWQSGGYGVNIFCDLTSSGRPFARTSRYYNEERQDTSWCFGLIKGGNWLNNPLTFFNKDGWGWNESILNQSITTMSLENAFYNDQQQAQATAASESYGRTVEDSYSMSGMYKDEVAAKQALNQQTFLEQTNAVNIGGFLKALTQDVLLDTDKGLGGLAKDRLNRQNEIINKQNALQQQSLANNIFAAGLNNKLTGDRTATNIANAGAVLGSRVALEKLAYTQANTSVAPTLKYPRATGLSLFTNNSFFIVQARLDDRDLARFDKFLGMYGYATNKFLEVSDFKSRSKFNYVQGSIDYLGVSTKTPNYIIDMLKERIRAGVRLWHTKPTNNAWESN